MTLDTLLGFALQSATSTEGAPHFSGPADEVGHYRRRLTQCCFLQMVAESVGPLQ